MGDEEIEEGKRVAGWRMERVTMNGGRAAAAAAEGKEEDLY